MTTAWNYLFSNVIKCGYPIGLMHIPKYWALGTSPAPRPTGRPAAVSCWKWSDVSVADAQRQADARAIELAQIARAGARLDRYWYGDRPLREEIVQTLAGGAGDESAVITRNLYGALVLNAAGAMFIDIDFAGAGTGQSAPQGGVLSRLFGKARPTDVEQSTLERVQAWVAPQLGLGLRVYRTHAGLRCLVTSQTVDPAAPETIELLKSAGSDPLYVRLCQAQACFRARLTPKPWRCGLPAPPVRYPWISRQHESLFRQWQSDYERLIPVYSVCRFLRHVGPAAVHRDIQPILALHDRFTCAQPERPLA